MNDTASTGPFDPDLDEAALLARMQAGDGGAFEACGRAHIGRLLAVARRILNHDDDARDAVQTLSRPPSTKAARFPRRRARVTSSTRHALIRRASPARDRA